MLWVREERNAVEVVLVMTERRPTVVRVRGARISCSRRVSLPASVYCTYVHRHAAVEYVEHLLAQRQHFTERLQRARAMLPPGHPALGLARPPEELPLWEREWTGGMGAKDDDDAGDASGDDDEP
jgi:hypothetical protein